MEHLVDFLFEHPFIIFIVPLAFTVFSGFIVSLVLTVGLFWARHVLAERRREAEERRLDREERRAERVSREAERASRQAEREARQREREQGCRHPADDVSPRRYVSGEYAEFIQH
jgi:type VI protein secretion system component VasK